jgi:hypothetical protein
MSMLADIKDNVTNHMKLLPDQHIAEPADFEAWGKEFADHIVSVSYSMMNDMLTQPRPSMKLSQ